MLFLQHVLQLHVDAGHAEPSDELAVDKNAELSHDAVVACDDGPRRPCFAVVIDEDGPRALGGCFGPHRNELHERYTHGLHAVLHRVHRMHERKGDVHVVRAACARHGVMQRRIEIAQKAVLHAKHTERLVWRTHRRAQRRLDYAARHVGLAYVHHQAQVVLERRHVNLNIFEDVVHPLAAVVIFSDFFFVRFKSSLVDERQAFYVGLTLVPAAAHWTAHVRQHEVQGKRGHVKAVRARQRCGVVFLVLECPLTGQVIHGHLARAHLENVAERVVGGATCVQLTDHLASGTGVAKRVLRATMHFAVSCFS